MVITLEHKAKVYLQCATCLEMVPIEIKFIGYNTAEGMRLTTSLDRTMVDWKVVYQGKAMCPECLVAEY